MFCLQNVCMCFVWISERTAISFLYSIKWSVLWPREIVFTARYGLGRLNTFQVNCGTNLFIYERNMRRLPVVRKTIGNVCWSKIFIALWWINFVTFCCPQLQQGRHCTCKGNIVTLSRNHCLPWKSNIYYMFWVHVYSPRYPA